MSGVVTMVFWFTTKSAQLVNGPPVAPLTTGRRQRYDLATDGDLVRVVDRLVSLGAARIRSGRDGTVVLTDPDDNEFDVRAG